MDLAGFFLALSGSFVSLMSGAFSLLLTVAGFIVPGRHLRKVFWSSALICFFLASVKIWTEQNQRYSEEARKYQDETRLNQPALVGQLVVVNCHPVKLIKGSALLLGIRIANRGADSIATNFCLRAKIEGHEVFGQPYRIPHELGLSGSTGAILYKEADALYMKTQSERPIKRGTEVYGLAWYGFPNVPQDTLYRSSFKLTFEDINRTRYTIDSTDFKGVSGEPVFYPGLTAIVMPIHRQ